jgi:hypothetical protein
MRKDFLTNQMYDVLEFPLLIPYPKEIGKLGI